jgi:hypothetical protein
MMSGCHAAVEHENAGDDRDGNPVRIGDSVRGTLLYDAWEGAAEHLTYTLTAAAADLYPGWLSIEALSQRRGGRVVTANHWRRCRAG